MDRLTQLKPVFVEFIPFVSRLACVDHLVDLGPKNCFVFIDQRVIDVTEAFAEIMAEIASEVDRVELSDQWEK